MKWPELSTLTIFVCKALLCLPFCFAIWYYCTWLMIPLAMLSELFLNLFWGEAIEAVEQSGHLFDIVTRFMPPGSQDSRQALVFELNPFKYSYSLPFAMALIVATPAAWIKKISALLIAYLILSLVQSWGVCFEVIKTLVFDFPPETRSNYQLSPLSQGLIGLAYQFGYLILPGLSPLMVWVALFPKFVQNLVPQNNNLRRSK